MAKQFNLKRVMQPAKDIVRKLKDRRSYLMEEVTMIEGHLAAIGGKIAKRAKSMVSGNGTESTETTGTKRKGKRTRRSREELVTMAGEVVALIKSKGKEGASAADVKSQFGNLLPSVNAWLKLYSPTKVKTTGSKSKMRYFA
jgi:hypothetical protein